MSGNGGDENENRWANWAGNLSSAPDQIARPSNVAEVQALVRASRGRNIRAFGTGHSFSPLIVANGQTLVDLSNLTGGGPKAWRHQDKGLNLVTFLPSAKWEEVRDALTTQSSPLPRMYLSSTGALASINATGFVAAGCHGTGWHQQTVSDLIYAIEFVGADGQVHMFSEETTPDEMAAVRVNLGTLGVITKVTMRVEPLYRLLDEEIIVPTENVMGPNPQKTDGEIWPGNLHKLVTQNEYVELFWFPGSGYDGEIWVKKFNRTQDDLRDTPLRPDGWIDQIADRVMSWTAGNPLMWNVVLPTVWRTIKQRVGAIQEKHGFVGEAPRVLFYAEKAFPILDLEVTIPIPATGPGTWDVSNVVRAWYHALNYAYKHQGEFPLTACLHARFTKTSPSLLSAAYSTKPDDRICWIEILSAYPKSEPDANKRVAAMAPHIAMINEVVTKWLGMNGRPHWAKNWQYVSPLVDVKALYPNDNLNKFNLVRRRMDPDGMFINPFLKGLHLFS